VQRFLKTRLALLHKEWRDVRALTIVCALLVPIALLGLEYGYLDWRGDFAAETYVPACIALFLAVISADLIAADIATKRARAYAALPTRWSSLWASKVTFLMLAGVAFTVWTVTSCAAVYATLAPEQANAQFLEGLARIPLEYALAALFGVTSVVFWSTILERGFAVVGAAVVTCTAIGGTLPLLAWISPELLPDDAAIRASLIALAIVFLVGSLFAFVRCPHHSSSVWRRLATAALVPLVVLVPAGAVSAAVLSERLVVTPGDPDLRLALGHVSPDGRRLVIHAAKRHERASSRTWILDLEDGSLAVLGERDLQADWFDAWTEDGAYRAWTRGRPFEEDLRRIYDPETGKVQETRSADQVGNERQYPFIDWATTRIEKGELIVTLAGSGEERRLAANRHPQFSPLAGYALRSDDEGIHILDLVNDTSRLIWEREGFPNAQFSPTGAYVVTYSRSVTAVFETHTGKEVYRGESAWLYFPGGGSDDRFAILSSNSELTRLIDLVTGTEHTIDSVSGFALDAIRVLPDHRVIVRIPNNSRIEIRDLDGGHRRIVYAPHKEN